MKSKLLNACLILTSLVTYLEWDGGNSMLLYQGEIEIFKKLFSGPTAVLHPFVLIPIVGQLLLLFSLFQNKPSKIVSLIGMWLISILILFVFFFGWMRLNLKLILSTLPFVITLAIANVYYKKSR